MDSSWLKHHQLVTENQMPPSIPLSKAFEHLQSGVHREWFTADLGSGGGVDTRAMLAKGWNVLAIDQDANALNQLEEQPKLECSIQLFETLKLPKLDLVNASMSLPFCDSRFFPACWDEIGASISPAGYFCGHLFGEQDSWAERSGMNFHSMAAIKKLFSSYEIIWFDEIEKDGKTIGGAPKHWHVYSILARKSG